MDAFQALVYGRHVRRQLVHSVREEYEKTVKEIEGSASLENRVSWRRPGTLCYPVFTEPGEAVTPDQDRRLSSEQPQPQTKAPITAMEGLPELSFTSPSSTSSANNTLDKDKSCVEEYTKEACESEALSSPNTASECVTDRKEKPLSLHTTASTNGSEKCQHDSPEGRDVVLELLLNSEPLVVDSFPKDKQSLLELRSQTAMELAWLKQAISSRQKYLQIKSQMMKTE